MGLKIWFADELSNVLDAIEMANNDVTDALNGPAADAYRQGFHAAISAMRQAIGAPQQTQRARTLSQARLPDYSR